MSTTRRPKGEGTYYQDPRTGLWIYENRAWIPGRKVKGRGASRALAKADAREKRDHIIAGRPSGRPETFGEMLDAWLELSVRPNMTIEAYRSRASIIRNWLKPSLGQIPAHTLRPSQLEEQVYRQVFEQGLARSYALAMKSIVSVAYGWAMADGRIAGKEPGTLWNPARTSTIPVRRAKTSRTAPSVAQVEGLLQITDPIVSGPLWRVMAECALRPSEAAGLRWVDIDFDSAHLHVRGALRLDKELGEYRWSPGTKTGEGGIRSIPILDELAALLARQQADILELQMMSEWESDAWAMDLVFRQADDGRAWHSPQIFHTQQRLLKAAEIDHFAPYQLRHFRPTRLANRGVPPKTIADMLGISLATAMSYYIDRPEVAIDRKILEAAW